MLSKGDCKLKILNYQKKKKATERCQFNEVTAVLVKI